MADLDGAGGAKTFPFDFFNDTSISNFGAFGTGGTPADPAELDTLAFTANGLTAANMILLQQGTSVLVRFDGGSSGAITLENTTIEQLGNIAGVGNFRFFGEATVTDSLDIWGAAESGAKVHSPGTVTFLNALGNDVSGFNQGNDVINGLAGNDTLNGFAGNDLLRGGEGDDVLIGGLDNDRLQGDEGSDTLTGGRGDDVLDGGGGDDVLTGGKGNDVYVVDSLGDTIVEDIQNSRSGGWADEVRSSVSFSLASYTRIENLTLTGEGAELDGTGNTLANVITGTEGFNNLKGGGGDDVLVGGGGGDEYHGGTGNDIIVLGEGDDAASGENGDPALVDGGSGLDTVATEGFGRELDLTSDLRTHFVAVEAFDLGAGGPATLILDAANVAQLAAANNNTVLIRGDAEDLLAFGDSGWIEGGTKVNPFGQAGTFAVWTNGIATVLIEDGVKVSSSNIDIATLSNDEGFKIAGAAIVGSAGDVNADGFDDVIVGAPTADPLGRTDAGESYVIYGKADGIGDIDLATLTAAQGFKLSGAAAGDASGTSVSRAGDINGDGIEDIIVGAPLADRAGLDHAGESYVVYGKEGGLADIDLAALDPAHGFKIVGPVPPNSYDGSYSGRVVNAAGDINDDGIDDILIGTGNQNFLVYGKAGGLGDVDLGALTAATGANIHGVFAHMIDGGGDINGDGIDDIVVGTRGDTINGEDSGETFVIYGKVGGIGDVDLFAFPPTQGFRIAGAGREDLSGYAVSSAGDINGDGIADVLIGSYPEEPSGHYGAGLAYVVYGKDGGPGDIDLATLTPAEGFKITGVSFEQFESTSVSDAGDVNGDGLDDIIVNGAFVIYGKQGGLSDIELAALTDDQGFRISTGDKVSRAGDVNGDGFADLIVGTGDQSAVIYGGNFTKSVTHLGTENDDELPGSEADEVFVGGLGNDLLIGGGGKDAFHGGAGDDTIVLAPGDVTRVDGGNGVDRVMANDFGTELDFTGDLRGRFQSIEVLDLSGFVMNHVTLDSASIAHMTGSNGDAFEPNTLVIRGEADFVIFADQGWINGGEVADPLGQGDIYNSWTNGAVAVLVDFKSQAMQAPRIDLADLAPEDGFTIEGATGVGTAGDLNADGIADFVVNADKSYVIFGKADGLESVDLATLTPDQGFAVSRSALPGDEGGPGGGATGDFNGDGIDDVIFGQPFADTAAGADAGQAYVIFGAASGLGAIDVTTMPAAQGFRISGGAAGDWAGFAAESAGDFDGDGIDDIIIGAREADPLGRYSAGEAYVIYGKLGGPGDIDLAALTAAQGFRIAGPSDSDDLGDAARSAGDINGDGYDDIAIGAPFSGSGAGAVYVIYGKAGGSGDVDLATLSASDGFKLLVNDDDFLGRAVGSAGDINGDGINDLVVSAYRGGYGGSGLVYVIYGKEGGLSDIDPTTLTDEQGFQIEFHESQSSARLGRSVHAAGDVNGDGIDDLVFGAPGRDVADRYGAGQAYVIFGKEGGHGDIDLRSLREDQGFAISGAASYDGTGHDVSAADVNGDGFTDVLVGGNGAHVIYGGNITGVVSHLGTSGDDTLTGTGADEVFVGGLGNDVLVGGGTHDFGDGGADAFQGAGGDDVIHVIDGTFKKVDGGPGSDTLQLDFLPPIDLGNIDGDAATADHTKIRSIETIDIDNDSSNGITLRLADVLAIDPQNSDVGGVASLDNVLKIDGNIGDGLSLDPADGWSAPDTATLTGYAIYAAGNVKIAVDQDIVVAVA